ncbi:MAG: hypothetical protein NVS2B11_12460 [Acetobacteraceae bacterium]
MPQGLSVSDVVSVGIILSPTAAVGRNFGTLLILGSSPTIDTTERIRQYTSLTGVAQDFGTTAPEYLAAAAFFGQSPMPYLLKIGRWAQTASAGVLHGATLTAAQQASALLTIQGVAAGTLTVSIDGTPKVMTALAFGAVLNLNGVAGVITTALGASGTCTWTGSRFDIRSGTTGVLSSVGYGVSPTGTDIATPMGLTLASGAGTPAVGIAAETPVAAVQVFAALTGDWYALTFAPAGIAITDVQNLAVAASIEGIAPVRVFGLTVQTSSAIDPTSTTDLGAQLAASLYARTIVQYSSTNAYAICSFFGRGLGVNFTGSKTTLTMKFKQEPGVIAETLTETQAAALGTKNINVFVNYQNATAILQQGTVANGRFWDEVHGLDYLANAVQTDLYNVLYQSLTKIPQTDDGVHVLLTQFEATLAVSVENGLIAPGIWNAEGFGQLKRGDPLPKGFYVFAPLVASQSQADREARKAPMLQAAIKMAGAIHSVNTQISVNR